MNGPLQGEFRDHYLILLCAMCSRMIALAALTLPETEYSPDLLASLEDHYAPGRSLSEAFGRLLLQLEGNEFWLEIYADPGTGDLSVFFTDRTNGHQTYGGGRYAPVHALGLGMYLIDFNEAYNPYCAYNSDYVCPLPPPQNRLSSAVTAGEKSYGPDLATENPPGLGVGGPR